MDKLKQFIDSNKEEFDEVDLPEGHFERFEKKLSARRRRPVRLYTLFGIVAAACIALLLIFKPSTDLYMDDDPTANVCEIEELQLYYTMRMNDVLSKIEAVYEKAPSPGSSQLMAATQTVLHDSEEFEEQVLPTLPCSEEGIFAVNQHYENSLASLRIMLNQMENVTDIKQEDPN